LTVLTFDSGSKKIGKLYQATLNPAQSWARPD
jgi:hypothetical protein